MPFKQRALDEREGGGKPIKGSILNFLIRHFVASFLSVITPILLVIVGYIILLIVALITHQGPGGPLTLPFWAIAAGIICLLYTACIVFPAVAVSELISTRLPAHQLLAQIPISMLVLAMLVFGLAYGSSLVLIDTDSPLLQLIRHPLKITIFLCLPLGYYWWIAKTAQRSMRGLGGLLDKIFHKQNR